MAEIQVKTQTSVTFKSRDTRESLLTPELLILMNDISTCILLVRLKKLFLIFKFLSVIFVGTVEMLSLFQYKSNNLPIMGGSSSPTPFYATATAQSLIQSSVRKIFIFFPSMNRFRNENYIYMFENNCTILCGCYQITCVCVVICVFFVCGGFFFVCWFVVCCFCVCGWVLLCFVVVVLVVVVWFF